MAPQAKLALGVRVARSIYGRWRVLAPGERERLGVLAQTVKDRALNLRGTSDRPAAERELVSANRELADALVDSARSDPEVEAADVERLRDELARELERLASADVTARRGTAPEAPARPDAPS
jgi:hypothetical protein